MSTLRLPFMTRPNLEQDEPAEEESDAAGAMPAVVRRLSAVREFVVSLLDLEFRQLLTPRMVPTLYLLGILASGYGVVAYAVDGFSQSLTLGLVRLLLIGPIALIVLVTLTRVALELCIAIFRIAVHVNELAGHAEDIAGGIPRISFWKPRNKR